MVPQFISSSPSSASALSAPSFVSFVSLAPFVCVVSSVYCSLHPLHRLSALYALSHISPPSPSPSSCWCVLNSVMKNDKVGDPFCQGQDEIINQTPLSPCYKPYYSTDGYSGYHQDVLPSEGSNHREMARASANKLRHPPSPCQSKHKTVAQSIPPSLLSPSMPSGWPLSDYKIFECEWDLPNVFPSLPSAFPGQNKFLTEVVDVKEVLFNTLTLTRSDECVKASTCGKYVGEIYGVEGIRLLSHIVSALGSEDGESSE